jgi:hypothetical protein
MKKKTVSACSIKMTLDEYNLLRENLENYELEEFDEVKITINKDGKGRIRAHLSGRFEPEPPDDVEDDFELSK